MVVSVYNPKVKTRWKTVATLLTEVNEAGFRPLLLVSASPEQMESVFRKHTDQTEVLRENLYYSDYKTLVAMNRSNGGVTYFSDGYLVRKWALGNSPGISELNDIYIGDDTETIIESDSRGRLAFQGFMLYVFAIMLLL